MRRINLLASVTFSKAPPPCNYFPPAILKGLYWDHLISQDILQGPIKNRVKSKFPVKKFLYQGGGGGAGGNCGGGGSEHGTEVSCSC